MRKLRRKVSTAVDAALRLLALPFLRRLRDEGFLSEYQCELLGLGEAS